MGDRDCFSIVWTPSRSQTDLVLVHAGLAHHVTAQDVTSSSDYIADTLQAQERWKDAKNGQRDDGEESSQSGQNDKSGPTVLVMGDQIPAVALGLWLRLVYGRVNEVVLDALSIQDLAHCLATLPLLAGTRDLRLGSRSLTPLLVSRLEKGLCPYRSHRDCCLAFETTDVMPVCGIFEVLSILSDRDARRWEAGRQTQRLELLLRLWSLRFGIETFEDRTDVLSLASALASMAQRRVGAGSAVDMYLDCTRVFPDLDFGSALDDRMARSAPHMRALLSDGRAILYGEAVHGVVATTLSEWDDAEESGRAQGDGQGQDLAHTFLVPFSGSLEAAVDDLLGAMTCGGASSENTEDSFDNESTTSTTTTTAITTTVLLCRKLSTGKEAEDGAGKNDNNDNNDDNDDNDDGDRPGVFSILGEGRQSGTVFVDLEHTRKAHGGVSAFVTERANIAPHQAWTDGTRVFASVACLASVVARCTYVPRGTFMSRNGSDGGGGDDVPLIHPGWGYSTFGLDGMRNVSLLRNKRTRSMLTGQPRPWNLPTSPFGFETNRKTRTDLRSESSVIDVLHHTR